MPSIEMTFHVGRAATIVESLPPAPGGATARIMAKVAKEGPLKATIYLNRAKAAQVADVLNKWLDRDYATLERYAKAMERELQLLRRQADSAK